MAKENKIKNLDQVFKFVKLKPFVESYTSLSVTGGIYRNINPKVDREDNSQNDLTRKQEIEVKQGLIDLIDDLNTIANSID